MYLFEDKKYDKRNFLTSSILLGFPEKPGEYFSTLFTSLKSRRLKKNLLVAVESVKMKQTCNSQIYT